MSPQFLIVLTVVSASGADDAGGLQASGFAANYVADRGIAANPEVILADDFESWGAGGTERPSDTWRVRRNDVSRTHVVPGRFELDGRPPASLAAIGLLTTRSSSDSSLSPRIFPQRRMLAIGCELLLYSFFGWHAPASTRHASKSFLASSCQPSLARTNQCGKNRNRRRRSAPRRIQTGWNCLRKRPHRLAQGLIRRQ